VQPETYNFQASFDAITMVILGGSGSVTGAALGGVFVTFSLKAIEFLQGLIKSIELPSGDDAQLSLKNVLLTYLLKLDLNALRMMVYASVLIGLMILRPEGLLGERELFAKRNRPKPPTDPKVPIVVPVSIEASS
jgi:branched-chain amino acid transport system permease protein